MYKSTVHMLYNMKHQAYTQIEISKERTTEILFRDTKNAWSIKIIT